jgi:hypothetical protein
MDKINKIKEVLKKYQTTSEYKKKGQFDLKFKGDDDPVGIYEFEDDIFVLTADGWDMHISKFDSDTITEIYKQVCKK